MCESGNGWQESISRPGEGAKSRAGDSALIRQVRDDTIGRGVHVRPVSFVEKENPH